MLTYIVRRLLLMIPTLLGITMLVFFVMASAPGGVAGRMLDETQQMRPEERQIIVEYYNKRYGLDKPKVVQYGRWLNQISPVGFAIEEDGDLGAFGFKAPSLGESFHRRRPVTSLIAEALPVTLLLNAIAIPLVYIVGILTGIFAARERGRWFDTSWSMLSLALWSVPAIWAGVMLLGYFASTEYLNWFPTGGLHHMLADNMTFLPRWSDTGFERGWLLDMLWHLALPLICLTYGGWAFLMKLMRGTILDNLTADYIRTARAKGVDEKTILFRHVFRNSMLPLITVAAGILPGMLGGSVIIETIFSIPGMGKMAIEAVKFNDRELVLAITLIGGLIGLTAEIVRDVCYAIADPRVSYE